jgi:hypothetical protein
MIETSDESAKNRVAGSGVSVGGMAVFVTVGGMEVAVAVGGTEVGDGVGVGVGAGAINPHAIWTTIKIIIPTIVFFIIFSPINF